MKLKSWMTTSILSALITGTVTWFYFHWSEEKSTPTLAEVTEQSSINKSIEHKWFDATQIPPTKTENKFEFVDAYGHIVDLHGTTIGQYVKDLYHAANQGDVTAAFNIYSAETVCTSIQNQQRELQPISASDPNYEYVQNAFKKGQALCTDVNASPKERLGYLVTAAKGGVAQAQIAFANELPEGINLTNGSFDQADPRVLAWEKDVVYFMTEAAMHGNQLALIQLGIIYEQGAITTQNLPLALTYQVAAAEIRNPGSTNAIITRLSEHLTADQVAVATAAANKLVKSAATGLSTFE